MKFGVFSFSLQALHSVLLTLPDKWVRDFRVGIRERSWAQVAFGPPRTPESPRKTARGSVLSVRAARRTRRPTLSPRTHSLMGRCVCVVRVFAPDRRFISTRKASTMTDGSRWVFVKRELATLSGHHVKHDSTGVIRGNVLRVDRYLPRACPTNSRRDKTDRKMYPSYALSRTVEWEGGVSIYPAPLRPSVVEITRFLYIIPSPFPSPY